jgi:hypothetical protein
MSLAKSILKRWASTMKQLDCKGYGSRDVLFFGEAPIPVLSYCFARDFLVLK